MKNVRKICILCGSANRTVLYSRNEWKVYKCIECNLGVLDPQPDNEELASLYQQEYFQSNYNDKLLLDSPEMKQRLKQEKHRVRFFRKLKKSGKVLDIGCGRGYFLLACQKRGYEVEGIDISTDASIYVSKELKIPVHVGDVNSINLPEKSFDVITMWHSLEHTVDPNVYMQITRRWLKDDGLLVVDVPNYASHDAIKTWNNWLGWQIPYHFYHFTKSSLFLLLSKHGFSVIRKKHYLSEHLKQKLESAFLPSFVARIIAKFYSGHSFAVIAKKIYS
jgi:2-polyprenyl-3-methyl-5-hydroxy-6-metoxy-1,4-benzoquinol methylase